MTEASQTLQTAPVQDTLESGSEEAAALALTNRAQQTEEPTTEAEDSEADPNAEASDGETDEDTEPTLTELEYEGTKFSVPADKAEEIRKAMLRQPDYSRKMNEVSAKEKTAQQALEHAETLKQGSVKFAEALANIRVLDMRIKQFDAVNWQQLRSEDPAQYAVYATDLQTLNLNKQQAEQVARGVAHDVSLATNQALQTKRDAMFETLKKTLPGWGDQMGEQVTDYAKANGMAVETLKTLTDPAVVVALEKARKYDALQASKAALKATVKDAPPVLKPGVVRKPDVRADAMTRFNNSRGDEDAIAALGARTRR